MTDDERPYAEWPTDEVRDARDELLAKVETMETELDQRRFERSVVVGFFEEMEAMHEFEDDDLLDEYLKTIRVRGLDVIDQVKMILTEVYDVPKDELDDITFIFDETAFGDDEQ